MPQNNRTCFTLIITLQNQGRPGSLPFAFTQVQFSSVIQLCPTLCYPMDCSTPGFPVQHQLLELAQTHVHQVGDAIQPSVVLFSSCLQLVLPSIRVFSNESVLGIRWPKYWSFSLSISPSSKYSKLICLELNVLITLQSKGL